PQLILRAMYASRPSAFSNSTSASTSSSTRLSGAACKLDPTENTPIAHAKESSRNLPSKPCPNLCLRRIVMESLESFLPRAAKSTKDKGTSDGGLLAAHRSYYKFKLCSGC